MRRGHPVPRAPTAPTPGGTSSPARLVRVDDLAATNAMDGEKGAAEPAAAPGTDTGPLPGGRAQPKTDKSEATRALILETAMRLFQERGYEKTTMRAIATEAGVSV